jgi:hypothetical protein
MGVTFDLLCLRCGERAPEVGDFGYIGYPALSSRKRLFRTPQNFGYIYDGLASVGLLPLEVEAFRLFLERHRRHRLLPLPGFEDEDDGSLFALIRMWLSMGTFVLSHPTLVFRRGISGAMELLLDPEDEPLDPFSLVSESDFINARYRMTCAECDRSVATVNADLLRRFEARAVSPTERARFERNVLSLDPDSIYRATPLVDPYGDLAPFRDFLQHHSAHDVRADLVPA